MRLFKGFLTLGAILVLSTPVFSAVPSLMNYQGLLTDQNGVPLLNTNKSVDFTIYDGPGGAANIIWGPETHSVTTDGSGRFNVLLGAGTVPVPVTDAVFSADERWLGIKVAADPELTPRTRITTSAYAHRISTVDGAAGGTITGDVSISDGSTTNILLNDNVLGFGGGHYLYDESGNQIIGLEPDFDGTGGFLRVMRSAASAGFYFDANLGGSNEPLAVISGSVRSATFNMFNTGNASVALPTDAVASPEILDEPGVANNAASGVAVPDPGPGNLLSRSITVDGAGYIFAIGTCDASVSHTTGTSSNYAFGVSDVSATIPSNNDIQVFIPSAIATTLWDFPVTSQALFPVPSAGTYTFYFVGDKFGGAGSSTAFDIQLSLMYFPTAYGTTVDPTPAAMAAWQT